MEVGEDVLDSYGTGPRGRLGREGVSIGSPSKAPPSRMSDSNKGIANGDQETMEAKARMRAYERYKDRQVRSDHHFKFYKRLVPLSSIHARKHKQTNVDEKAVEALVSLIEREGWSVHLGRVTVCDDSIVPPNGPGTKIRSHLLSPTFSLLDGHRRIEALKEASNRGFAVPENIVVQVAVPAEGTSLGDIEVRLLEMTMRLNQAARQVAPVNPATKATIPRDVRRLVKLRSWLKAKREYRTMSVQCLGNGDIPKAASQAVKERAMKADQVSEKHLQRYIRALLMFEQSPKAFELYKQEMEKGNDTGTGLSIVTLSSAVMLRAEPAVQLLLIECLFAHINRRRTRFRRQEDTVFLRNITVVYEGVEKVAGKLGCNGTSFLSTIITLPSGESNPTRKCTMREALIAAASVRSMSTFEADVADVSIGLGKALTTAKRGGQTTRPLTVDATEPLPVSTVEPTQETEVPKENSVHQAHEKGGGEETASICLAAVDMQKQPGSTDTCEETSNICSEESEGEPVRNQPLRDMHTTVKATGRGQKRSGSPVPLSILRQKVFRRSGPFQSSGLKHRGHKVDTEGEGVQTQLSGEEDVLWRMSIRRNGQGSIGSPKQSRSVHATLLRKGEKLGSRRCQGHNVSKMASNDLPKSEKDTLATAFPACIPEDHGARLHLSGRDVQTLRAELWTLSSEMSCSHHGIFKEIQNTKVETSVLRCVQFATFWSDHKSSLDEKGYTQIGLATPLLTTAALTLMKNTAHLGDREDESQDWNRVAGMRTLAEMPRIEDAVKGISRSRACAEVEGEPRQLYKDRMLVETVLAVVAEWLGLYEVESGISSHAMFETGCSVLVLPEGSKVQRPRLAFGLRSYKGNSRPWSPPKDPSYMFVVTAEVGVPIWVWERTHVMLHGPDELLPLIAKHAKPERVYIEPRSIFLCRGDVIHVFGSSTSELDGNNLAKPVAILSHLVQRSIDRLEQPVSDGWWAKYVSTPCS